MQPYSFMLPHRHSSALAQLHQPIFVIFIEVQVIFVAECEKMPDAIATMVSDGLRFVANVEQPFGLTIAKHVYPPLLFREAIEKHQMARCEIVFISKKLAKKRTPELRVLPNLLDFPV